MLSRVRRLALKQYQLCRDALQRELGVKPEPETDGLYRSIHEKRATIRPTVGEPRVMPSKAAVPPGEFPRPEPEAVGPTKPAIAVLPFQNLSDDPEQEYFADGMVEEIITALSRFRNLFVIARNSSFTYKGRPVEVKQVGRELGVRYVLEGSVRRAGGRLRIAGQLIDTSTGTNLWADRFDGALAEVFELQDQVAASVVGAIAPKIESAEIERSRRKPTESLDAYDCYLRGMAALIQVTKESSQEALTWFNRAIKADPGFATAYGMAARCRAQRKAYGWMIDLERETAETAPLARKAAELGREDAVALCSAGFALGYVAGDIEDGDALIDRALKLNPNLASAWYFGGWFKVWLGEPDVAIDRIGRALRLSPLDPYTFLMQNATAYAHFIAGRYADAAASAEAALRDRPDHLSGLRVLAASSAMLGLQEQAGKAMKRIRELDPTRRLSNLGDVIPLRQAEHRSRLAEAFKKAGMPE